jgi:hypothetical protein
VVSPSERSWRWSIAAPYQRGALGFPTLPTDVATWTPGAQDDVQIDGLLNARVLVGGYDAVRARALDLRQAVADSGELGGFVIGPTGRVLVVQPRVDFGELRRTR